MLSLQVKKIAIAGRGLAGLSLSLRMAKAGWQPILFGRRSSPDNASRCAQGIVCNKGLIFAESPLFRAKLQALRSLPAWLDELELLSGLEIPRHLIGVEEPYWDEVDFQKTIRRVYRGNFWGCYRASHLTSLQWQNCPYKARSPLGYMKYPADGWFDVGAALDALEEANQKLGVQLIEDDIHDLQLTAEGLSFQTSKQTWSC
jgi:glycine/D-amino acid oxidase-like deaminating enzyme